MKKPDKDEYLKELRSFFDLHPIPPGYPFPPGVILDPAKFLDSHFSLIDHYGAKPVIRPYLNRLLALRSQLSAESPTFEHGTAGSPQDLEKV